MAGSGIKHIDVGVQLARSEWESEESHELVHGNAFPGTPVERQLFYRDDLHAWYIYNGTTWVSLQAAAIDKLDDIGDVDVASPSDGDFVYYDDASGLWKARALVDADIPAAIARDSEVDADIATHAALTTGVHWADADGVLTFPNQAGARAYLSGSDQTIPRSATTLIKLNATAFDRQSEFDVSVVSGTADATSANKLHDTGAFTEAESYYLNRAVWNTTDNTYTTVSGKDSDDQLSLADDIMADGEGYELFHSKYTAKNAGIYLIVGTFRILLDNGEKAYCYVYKDGSSIFIGRFSAGGDNVWGQPLALTVVELAVDDYIQMKAYHIADEDISAGNNVTSLTVAKIA